MVRPVIRGGWIWNLVRDIIVSYFLPALTKARSILNLVYSDRRHFGCSQVIETPSGSRRHSILSAGIWHCTVTWFDRAKSSNMLGRECEWSLSCAMVWLLKASRFQLGSGNEVNFNNLFVPHLLIASRSPAKVVYDVNV